MTNVLLISQKINEKIVISTINGIFLSEKFNIRNFYRGFWINYKNWKNHIAEGGINVI